MSIYVIKYIDVVVIEGSVTLYVSDDSRVVPLLMYETDQIVKLKSKDK